MHSTLQRYVGLQNLAADPSTSRRWSCHQQTKGCRNTNKRHTRRSAAQTDTETDIQIEGLTSDYCDDFVCTSSPAVEQNLRSLSRDLTRLNTWTISLFAKDVQYQDPFLSYTGTAPYLRKSYAASYVQSPKVLVTRLSLQSKDTGRVNYRLRGSIAAVPIDVDLESEFELNLLTGRVLKHKERWDLSRTSLPGKLLFNLTRGLWSVQQRAKDVQDGGRGLVEKVKAGVEGEQQQGLSQNPDDPTRFFQQPDQGNSVRRVLHI